MRPLIVLSALLLATTSAVAQPEPPGPPPGEYGSPPSPYPNHMKMRERFEAANVTHDGKLTMDQAEAAHMKRIVRHFSEIDADHKGYITLQDLHRWTRENRAAHAGQMGGPPGETPPPGYGPPPGYAPQPGYPPQQGYPPSPEGPPPQ